MSDEPEISWTEVEVRSRCVGCLAPMIYVAEVPARKHSSGSYGAPYFEPKESHAVSHGHGHLCASCAGHVAILLERLREDRRRLEAVR